MVAKTKIWTIGSFQIFLFNKKGNIKKYFDYYIFMCQIIAVLSEMIQEKN